MNNYILTLFIIFFQIGLFSIGGGYAITPLIQEQVVNTYHWITIQEYTDIITISQMTPGPLVVNTASFVGIRLAGVGGAIAATIGSILSGTVFSIALYKFFKKYRNIDSVANVLKGLTASSVGLIASATSTIILIAMDLRQYSGHIFRESFFETNPLSRMCHRFRLISNGEPYLT
ncbi:chromate transporter, partial [Tetragenococcus halophilus]|uniref:chromate transporter n=1 Tax=Tetragenococcus halophilus TaxID=51669 RepID=UPI00209B6A0E